MALLIEKKKKRKKKKEKEKEERYGLGRWLMYTFFWKGSCGRIKNGLIWNVA